MDKLDLQTINELIALVDSERLAELTVEHQGQRITVKGSPPGEGAVETSKSAVSAPAETSSTSENPEAIPSHLYQIASPMLGIFYRAPAPDAPPFAEIGSVVEVGDTVGLVEAMKVFNEITAEFDGKIVGIPAQNAQLVHPGDVLVVIEKTAD